MRQLPSWMQKAATLRKQGKTWEQVASECGVSVRRLYRWKRRLATRHNLPVKVSA